MLQQCYEGNAEFLPGPSEEVVFEDEAISLQLPRFNCPIESAMEMGGWRLTPLNRMEVRDGERTFTTLVLYIACHDHMCRCSGGL